VNCPLNTVDICGGKLISILRHLTSSTNWQVRSFYFYPSGAVVEHATHNPKIKGFNPAAGTGGEKMAKS